MAQVGNIPLIILNMLSGWNRYEREVGATEVVAAAAAASAEVVPSDCLKSLKSPKSSSSLTPPSMAGSCVFTIASVGLEVCVVSAGNVANSCGFGLKLY